MTIDNELKEKILQGTKKSLETIGINHLKEIINLSEKEKREYGTIFCGNQLPPFGNISHANICSGKSCTIELKDCEGRHQIGTFHTHPHVENAINISNLSGHDIHHTISHKQSFACIGLIDNDNNKENKPIIKCFIPGLYIEPNVVINSFLADKDYSNKLLELKTKAAHSVFNKEQINELIHAYDRRVQADDELYRESKWLANLLKADLIIR